MERILCFAPVAGPQSRAIILGTMPSVQSLRENFYYAHPRNAFWPILNEAFCREARSVEEKRALILEGGLALWDVMRSCERRGSLDSAIRSPEPNDFDALFARYPGIRFVIFNGAKAEELFFRFAAQSLGGREAKRLPSTSPANTVAYETKRLAWFAEFRRLGLLAARPEEKSAEERSGEL